MKGNISPLKDFKAVIKPSLETRVPLLLGTGVTFVVGLTEVPGSGIIDGVNNITL